MLYGQDIAPSKPSAATIGYHIANLLKFWGDKTLSEVKGSTCRSYLKARPVKPSTVRRELKTFQAAINHWHRESPLVAVPRITLPSEGQRRERFLERSEVARLLRAARKLGYDHVARFILVGVYTGTRKGAILSLQWNRALRGGSVDTKRGIVYRRGEGDQETSKRRPPVQLSARMHAHFLRWENRDLCCGEKYVLHWNGARIHSIKRAWSAVVRKAGLGRDVTPHVLRHTCATWALWRGETIWDVAGLIGADASTIQKVYGHHRIEVETRRRA
jgi:integrase